MPHTDLEARRAYKRAWHAAHPNYYKERRARLGDRIRAQKSARYRARKAADPDGVREQQRWRLVRQRFGLSKAQWFALFEAQGSRCRCCDSVEPGSSKGWHIYHDHETGRVRGILCMFCNVLIGQLGESLPAIRATMQRVFVYLESPCPSI